MRGRALYEFQASDETELSFNVGDILTILAQDPSGWWQAELANRKGMIPGNYLEIIEDAAPVRAAASAVEVDLLSAPPPSVATTGEASGAAAATDGTAEPKKIGKVEQRVADILAKGHSVGLSIREKIQRFDDRSGVSTKVKDFDQKHHISEKVSAMDQKVNRWERDFKAGEKVERAQERLSESMKEFREKHPKFTETTDKVLNKTNEVLETVAAKTSQLAAKVEQSDFFQSLKRQVGKITTSLGTKASAVAAETGKQVEVQEEKEKH